MGSVAFAPARSCKSTMTLQRSSGDASHSIESIMIGFVNEPARTIMSAVSRRA